MSFLKFHLGRPDFDTMQNIASQAGVDLPANTNNAGEYHIEYVSNDLIRWTGADLSNLPSSQQTTILDAAETVLGVRPEIANPPEWY